MYINFVDFSSAYCGTNHRAPMKWDMKAMESSLKDETEAGGNLLNHAKVEPLRVMAKALHLKGSWYPCSSI